MIKTLLLLTIISLAGCAVGTPFNMIFAPDTLIDNNYYKVRQSSCAQFAYTAKSKPNAPRIACYTEEGEFKGEIRGMTPQGLADTMFLARTIVSAHYNNKNSKGSTSFLDFKPIEVNFGSHTSRSNSRPAIKLFTADQCSGPVVAGVCRGAIINPLPMRCHGQMILGECHGAISP